MLNLRQSGEILNAGDIYYSDWAFNSNFDYLTFTAYHEMRHSRNVLSGMYENVTIDMTIHAREEWSTYLYSYKNQGLYRNHGVRLAFRIIDYGTEAGIYAPYYTPTGKYGGAFKPQWWHSIYKIPRLW